MPVLQVPLVLETSFMMLRQHVYMGFRSGNAGSGGGFPPEYTGAAIIAEHGSWARTPAIGYRLAMVTISPNGTAARHTIFASGWLLRNGTVWGAFPPQCRWLNR